MAATVAVDPTKSAAAAAATFGIKDEVFLGSTSRFNDNDTNFTQPTPWSLSSSDPVEATYVSLIQQYLSVLCHDNATFLAERMVAHVGRTSLSTYLLAMCHYRAGSPKRARAILAMHGLASGDVISIRRLGVGTGGNVRPIGGPKDVIDSAALYLLAKCHSDLGLWHEVEDCLLRNCRSSYRVEGKEGETMDEYILRSSPCPVPNGAAGLNLLGMACRKTNRKKRAVAYFRMSLKLDPLMWTSFEALCEMGQNDENGIDDPVSVFGVFPDALKRVRGVAMPDQQQSEFAYSDSESSPLHPEGAPPFSRDTGQGAGRGWMPFGEAVGGMNDSMSRKHPSFATPFSRNSNPDMMIDENEEQGVSSMFTTTTALGTSIHPTFVETGRRSQVPPASLFGTVAKQPAPSVKNGKDHYPPTHRGVPPSLFNTPNLTPIQKRELLDSRSFHHTRQPHFGTGLSGTALIGHSGIPSSARMMDQYSDQHNQHIHSRGAMAGEEEAPPSSWMDPHTRQRMDAAIVGGGRASSAFSAASPLPSSASVLLRARGVAARLYYEPSPETTPPDEYRQSRAADTKTPMVSSARGVDGAASKSSKVRMSARYRRRLGGLSPPDRATSGQRDLGEFSREEKVSDAATSALHDGHLSHAASVVRTPAMTGASRTISSRHPENAILNVNGGDGREGDSDRRNKQEASLCFAGHSNDKPDTSSQNIYGEKRTLFPRSVDRSDPSEKDLTTMKKITTLNGYPRGDVDGSKNDYGNDTDAASVDAVSGKSVLPTDTTATDEPTEEGTNEDQGVQEILSLLCMLGAAQQMLCQYRCQESLQIFHQLPLSQFNTGWVQHQVGRAYFERADYQSAKRALETMEKIEPYRMRGLEVLSTTLWHLKKEVELSHLAQRVVDFDRSSPESWCVVGNCFSLQKEHETALTFFRRSIQLEPSFTYSHTLSGHEFVSNEDFEKAILCFRNAIRSDDRHYNAWYGLGAIYYRQEKYDLAEYHFRRALEINPQSSVLQCHLGMAQHANGKPHDALDTLAVAFQLNPRNPQARFQRANIWMSMDMPHEALEEFERVRDAAPREASVHFAMGRVLKRLGRPEQAMRCFLTALDLDPKDNNLIKSAMDRLDEPDVDEDVSAF